MPLKTALPTKDLEMDLDNFENWLDSKELFMDSLSINNDWSYLEIADQLKLHKVYELLFGFSVFLWLGKQVFQSEFRFSALIEWTRTDGKEKKEILKTELFIANSVLAIMIIWTLY